MASTIEQHSDSLFTVTFNSSDNIDTTVTAHSHAVDDWIRNIYNMYREHLSSLVVGFKVEWARTLDLPAALLQLCVGNRCLLFRLCYSYDIPRSLIGFLRNRNFTFVGVGIGDDIGKLNADYHLNVTRWMDLGLLAESEMGLEDLAAELMHVPNIERPPEVRDSHWDDDTLTLEEVKSACVYAYVSFVLGRILRAWEN